MEVVLCGAGGQHVCSTVRTMKEPDPIKQMQAAVCHLGDMFAAGGCSSRAAGSFRGCSHKTEGGCAACGGLATAHKLTIAGRFCYAYVLVVPLHRSALRTQTGGHGLCAAVPPRCTTRVLSFPRLQGAGPFQGLPWPVHTSALTNMNPDKQRQRRIHFAGCAGAC